MSIDVLNISLGEKALITTDNWFLAPDGKEYKGVFGTVKGVRTAEESLGVRPNGRSTNWYVEIGCMTVAGCQVHYAIRTDQCSPDPVPAWSSHPEQGIVKYERPSNIYFADAQP